MQNSSFTSSFKKIFLLALPFIIWQVVEVFFLPIDTFTFRAWETSSISEILSIPGMFYPNLDFVKIEAGDQDRYRIRRKRVHWVTDKYGFRNRPQNPEPKKYDAVLIGDSNFVGSYISQENTLTEVLARKCNCNVYNVAKGLSGNIIGFFNNTRFKTAPPSTVIFEIRRDDVTTKVLPTLKFCDPNSLEDADTFASLNCVPATLFQQIISKLPIDERVHVDRFLKLISLHFTKGKMSHYIRETVSFLRTGKWGPRPNEEFEIKYPAADQKVVEERIQYAFDKIISYHQAAKARGTRFIFLFLPSVDRKYDDLVYRLEKAGVETIGFLPNAKHSWTWDDYKNWIHAEDTHWLERSIDETADLIYEKLTNDQRVSGY